MGAWRRAIVLALLPAFLVGPSLAPGRLFLPQLPVALPPLATEHPAAAEAAREGMNTVTSDRLFPALTDQLAMRERLFERELPTWEPRLGLGMPLFGGNIASLAYPPNWLGALLPPHRVAGPLAMLALFLAGLGTWLLLERLGLPAGACAVGALAAQAGGWGVANLHYFMKVDAALWLPWQLWAVEGIARGVRRSGAWLAIATGLSLLAGFPPIAFFALACTVAWAAARLLLPRLRRARARGDTDPIERAVRFGGVLLFVALGAGLGAWQILPTVDASDSSIRTEQSAAEIESQTLPSPVALSLGVPHLFGPPTAHLYGWHNPLAWRLEGTDEWEKAQVANRLEWNLFVGVAVCVLALVGVVADPRRAAFPALGALACLGFAQGWPGVRQLYALPGFDLGAPSRIASVAWFLWPWLAAIGAQALIEVRLRAAVVASLASVAVLGVGLWLWVGIEPRGFALDLERDLARAHGRTVEEIREVVRPEDAVAAGEELARSGRIVFASALALLCCAGLALSVRLEGGRAARDPAVALRLGGAALAFLPGLVAVIALVPSLGGEPRQAEIVASLAALTCLAVVVATARDQRGLAFALPILAVLLLEGLQTSRPHLIPRRAIGELFPPSETIDAIAEAAGDGRVLRLAREEEGLAPIERLARPNMLQPYGIADATPFTVFTPRTLVELFGALDPRATHLSGVARLPDPALLDHPILDLARITCVLSERPVEHPRLEPVLEREGFHVYHRAGALPLARVVPEARVAATDAEALERLARPDHDPTEAVLLAPGSPRRPRVARRDGWEPGEVAVERPAANRLDARVEGSDGGWLVLHEGWAPGWRATVDGEEAEILRADHAFRAVRIPAGASVVRLRYAPAPVRNGLLLGLLSAAVLATILGRSLVNERRA